MTDRTVKVSLILAASGYMSGMEQVAQKTAKTGSEVEKLGQKKQVITDLGAAAIGFGAAAAAGVVLAVSKFAEFDQQMSYVQASTHETASNMDLLRNAALEAGASTVFSATEAAGAVEELAKAGVSTSDILAGALTGSLDLAAAGGLGVARAAEIASTALNQFELTGDQAAHVADVLAAGAGKAMGSVDDLAQGLKFVGPVANAMGISLEETTGVLSMFAQQGIIGEQAGTSLRGVLASLTAPSKQAAREIQYLGLNLYDAEGNFLGLQNAAGELSRAYSGMDDASRDASLGIIFGRETITAATALYKAGAAGVDEWTKKVDDSGYAAMTAAMRLDNLAGDVEALEGAFDTALIQAGGAANDTLRSLVQTATMLVDGFNAMPQPLQETALFLGVAVAAVGLLGGATLLATTRFAEFRANVKAADLSMKGLSFTAGAVTIGLTAVTMVVAAIAAAHADAAAKAEAYASTLDESTGAVTEYTREMIAKNLADAGAFEGAKQVGISQKELTDALYEGGAAYDAVNKKLRDSNDQQLFNVTLGNTINAVSGVNSQLADARTRHQDLNEAVGETVESSETVAGAYLAEQDALGGLNEELDQLIASVLEANGMNRDAVSANIAYQDALRSTEEHIANIKKGTDGYARGLDLNTASGSRNMEMLVGLAADAEKAASAQYALDHNSDVLRSTLESSRSSFINQARAMGASTSEAEELADRLLGIPAQTYWEVVAQTEFANDRLNGFMTRWDGRRINIRVDTYGGESYRVQGAPMSYNARGNLYEGGKPLAFAAGGFASGIYPYRKGGIHKFAEDYDEAYVSLNPKYIDRSRAITAELNSRLGMYVAPPVWQTTAPTVATGGPGGVAGTSLVVDQTGATFYSYDPTEVAKEAKLQLGRALDEAGLSAGS